jgi:hypothetical protein
VRSALEWAEVKAMAADGVSTSEIARRLGINWRTAARLAAATEAPSYSRAPVGSMLDPLEPVLRRLIKDFEDIKAPRVTEILREDYGYAGSVDLVRKRLAQLRPREERAARVGGRAAVLGRGDGALLLRYDDRVVSGGPRPRVRLAGRCPARVCL